MTPSGCTADIEQQNERNVNDSIDGNWYSHLDNGCFTDTMILSFQDKKIWAYNDGYKASFSKNLKVIHNKDSLIVEYTIAKGIGSSSKAINFKVHYDDLGETIIPQKSFRNGTRIQVTGDYKDSITLTRCSSPSFLAKINSWIGLRDVFVDGSDSVLLNCQKQAC
ncbi:MAG: hypothetical protein HRU28_14785 [Rhizobiales bacterium]|nr:hypothetical protein [Hyphomicrobiales bacterium]